MKFCSRISSERNYAYEINAEMPHLFLQITQGPPLEITFLKGQAHGLNTERLRGDLCNTPYLTSHHPSTKNFCGWRVAKGTYSNISYTPGATTVTSADPHHFAKFGTYGTGQLDMTFIEPLDAQEFFSCIRCLVQLHRRCWEGNVIAMAPNISDFQVETSKNIEISALQATVVWSWTKGMAFFLIKSETRVVKNKKNKKSGTQPPRAR